MDAPELRNGSDATVELIPQIAANGAVVTLVIIKQRWIITEDNRLVDAKAEVTFADELNDPDNPERSSIKAPSDVCLFKPNTDVVVIGHATEYDAAPVRELDVLVRVGSIERELKVFGPRVWYSGVTAMVPTPPEYFEAQPIRWEDAFGGFDTSDENAPPLEEARNPVGRGLVRHADSLLHQPCPSIEDPRGLIANHRSRPTPAGLGPIGRHWQPRRKYVGTMDQAWMETRMPLPPLDQDALHHQIAPAELIAPGYLRGGELVQIHHMHASGPIQFELPKLRFFVGARCDHELKEFKPVLDTVVLRPSDERSVDISWRTQVPMLRPASRVEYIQVHAKEWR